MLSVVLVLVVISSAHDNGNVLGSSAHGSSTIIRIVMLTHLITPLDAHATRLHQLLTSL